MVRQKDESGISGVGHVVTGVVFDDGTTVVKWNSRTSSVVIYNWFEDFKEVHITGHPSNESILKQFFVNIDSMGNFQ